MRMKAAQSAMVADAETLQAVVLSPPANKRLHHTITRL
jgi:hypothetical protein